MTGEGGRGKRAEGIMNDRRVENRKEERKIVEK